MKRLNPDKLHIFYGKRITQTNPIIPRRYTLTHSDVTAELFLTISSRFALEKITALRDEVLAEWQWCDNHYILIVYLHVDQGEFDDNTAFTRFHIFKRELPLALEAIRFGDQLFFQSHSFLDHAPIFVSFNSNYQAIPKIERWGTLSNYK